MMNARERRDMEELRAYYNKVQEAINQIQERKNKINLAACAEVSETSLAAGAAAFAAYKDCLDLLFAK
jgi:hypothetical protein